MWHSQEDDPISSLFQNDLEDEEREHQHILRTIEGVISDKYFQARDDAKLMWKEVQALLLRKA